MTATVVPIASFQEAVAVAADVRLSAFNLDPRQHVVRWLEAAADRKARVRVTLDGNMSYLAPERRGRLLTGNQDVADDLRGRGADVRFAGPLETLHLKAAIVDGVTYLDDRNWASDGPQTVLRIDDAAVAEAVRGAMVGAPVASSCPAGFAVTKDEALALEAAVATRPAGPALDVESETFGTGPLADALIARAATGARTRLLVSGDVDERTGEDESKALAAARAAGVEVHVGSATEKLCVAGDVAWVGSANASPSGRHATDWGYVARERAVVDDLRAAFERNWRSSAVWEPAAAAGGAPAADAGDAPAATLPRPSAA